MRLIACVLLALLPSFARARDYIMESSATLSLTVSYTGAEKTAYPSGKATIRAAREVYRINNRGLLDHLASLNVIPESAGWRLIAVWADWPETGNGYRFYVQNIRDRDAVHAVPGSVLTVEVLDGVVDRIHRRSDEAIAGGSETYKLYSRLVISDGACAGELLGLASGTGRYTRPRASDAAVYQPMAGRFDGVGVLSVFSVAADADAMISGTVTFGPGVAVPAGRYTADSGAGTVKTGSGTLILGGTSSSGGSSVTIIGGTLSSLGSSTSDTVTVVHLNNTSSGTLSLGGGSLQITQTGTVVLNLDGLVPDITLAETLLLGAQGVITPPLLLSGSGTFLQPPDAASTP